MLQFLKSSIQKKAEASLDINGLKEPAKIDQKNDTPTKTNSIGKQREGISDPSPVRMKLE